jgi:hypothetical protein
MAENWHSFMLPGGWTPMLTIDHVFSSRSIFCAVEFYDPAAEAVRVSL